MRHSHDFNEVNPLAEQRTRLVVLLTVIMMIVFAEFDSTRWVSVLKH